MQSVGEPVSEKGLFNKARPFAKPFNCLSSLEMGIEDDLGDGENPAGLQGEEELGQGPLPVGYFSENGNQQGNVELVLPQFPFPDSSLQSADVSEAEDCGFFLDPLKHALLDIHGDNLSARADVFGKRNGQPSRATAGIQDLHPGS